MYNVPSLLVNADHGYLVTENAPVLLDLPAALNGAYDELLAAYLNDGWTVLPKHVVLPALLNECNWVLVNYHLVGYYTGTVFWSADMVLNEAFVESGLAPEFLIPALTHLAHTHGCCRIEVGTKSCVTEGKHLALARMYQRQGLSIDCIELKLNLPPMERF